MMIEKIKHIENNKKVNKFSDIIYLMGIILFTIKFFTEKCVILHPEWRKCSRSLTY